MLIVYRTNEGFVGQIQSIDKTSTMAEFEASGIEDLAAIEVDEQVMNQALLVALAAEPAEFSVANKALMRDGEPVDLGYSIDANAVRLSMRVDPVLLAFFDMTDEQAVAWLAANGAQTALLLIMRTLRDMARATRIATR